MASGAKAMINTDYLDELFKTATTQQYDLSISGGSDKSKYFISLGYMDQDGLAVGSDLSRYSARINVSSKIKPWAEIGVTSTMSVNEQTPLRAVGGSSPLTNAFLSLMLSRSINWIMILIKSMMKKAILFITM